MPSHTERDPATFDATTAIRQSGAHVRNPASADGDTLAELTDALGELRALTSRRAARAVARLEDGVSAYPWTAIGVSAAAGAAIGYVAVRSRSAPRRTDTHHVAGFDSGTPPRYIPRAVATADAESLTSRLERVAEAVSRIDPNVATLPAFAKAREWVSSLLSRAPAAAKSD